MQRSNYDMKVERKDQLKKHLQEMMKNEENIKVMKDDDPDKINMIDDMIKQSTLIQQNDDKMRRTIDNRKI